MAIRTMTFGCLIFNNSALHSTNYNAFTFVSFVFTLYGLSYNIAKYSAIGFNYIENTTSNICVFPLDISFLNTNKELNSFVFLSVYYF